MADGVEGNLGWISVDDGIPSRVSCNKHFELGETIGSFGKKGITVLEEVKAGEKIFSIKQPIMAIINDKTALRNTCDNCFASKRPDPSNIEPEVRAGYKFLACGGCKLLHYCNWECQRAAWQHHHKHECKPLKYLAANANLGPIMTLRQCRFMIRLLSLYIEDQIPPAVWAEFMALPIERERKMNNTLNKFASVATKMAEALMMVLVSDLSVHKLIDLFCMMHHNQIALQVPILQGFRPCHAKNISSLLEVGIVVDPFVAQINHSCAANSSWYSEGPVLHIKAQRDIPANTELTFCLVVDMPPGGPRSQYLQSFLGITCNCPLCTDPVPSQISDPMKTAISMVRLEPIPTIPETQRMITILKEAGLPYTKYPMLNLNELLYTLALKEQNTSLALKTALTKYFLIQPHHTPPVTQEGRVSTWTNISTLLNILPLEPLPTEIQQFIPSLFPHVVAKLVRDIERCFGKDSQVARHQRREFEGVKRETNTKDLKDVSECEEVKRWYLESMKYLLRWADIDAV